MSDFGKRIYSTNEYKGYGKQNYYHNDYYQNGDEITKIKHHRQKMFNGNENEWIEEDSIVEKWNTDSTDIPEWLKQYIND